MKRIFIALVVVTLSVFGFITMAWQAEWAEIVAAAKREGSVVVVGRKVTRPARRLLSDFRKNIRRSRWSIAPPAEAGSFLFAELSTATARAWLRRIDIFAASTSLTLSRNFAGYCRVFGLTHYLSDDYIAWRDLGAR